MGAVQARIKSNKKGLTLRQKSARLFEVMRELNTKLKWLVSDLGLNELDAWLWMTGVAALTAAVIVYGLNL